MAYRVAAVSPGCFVVQYVRSYEYVCRGDYRMGLREELASRSRPPLPVLLGRVFREDETGVLRSYPVEVYLWATRVLFNVYYFCSL